MKHIEIVILETLIKNYGEILSSFKKTPTGYGDILRYQVEQTMLYAKGALEFYHKYKETLDGKYRNEYRHRFTEIQKKHPVPFMVENGETIFKF